MTKLFIQAVKPFVEVEVKVDGQDSIVIGFKAHSLKIKEEVAQLWTDFLENNKENYTALAQTQEQETFDKLSDEEKLAVMNKALEFVREQEVFSLKRLRDDVLYLKNVTVTTYDEEQVIYSFKVADTRTAEVLENFWGNPDEAKQVLLDSFLDDASWKEALLEKHREVSSTNPKVEQAKN